MAGFKDLFSNQSADYSKFRPRYPSELFDWLGRQVSQKKAAWDCGTGNGQAAVELGLRFETVFATDPSEKQLQKAESHPRVIYSSGSAENSGLQAASVDLITVAQAYHWFNHKAFFAEACRVGRPGAVVAVWTYNLARVSPEVDAAIEVLYDQILGDYWEPERRSVEVGYSDLPFEFQRIESPKFQMTAEWSFDHLIGYLGTWSALQAYVKKNGEDPREQIFVQLQNAWGPDLKRRVSWDLSLLAGLVS